MKIIFVTYCRAMFGANKCMITLVKDLRTRFGVESLVIVPEVNDGELEEILSKEKIKYIVSPMKPWVVSEKASFKFLRAIKAWKCNRKYVNDLSKILKDCNYDIVYSNNSTIQLGFDLAKKIKVPHIWHVREFGRNDYNIVYSYPLKFVRKKFIDSTMVISISEAVDEYIKKTLSSKINSVVIYDGVENTNIVEKKEYERKDNICNFVCVGVLQEGKNQIELLKASKLLLESKEKNFHIHFIGNGTEYEDYLMEYVANSGMNDYVTFYGKRNDVLSLLPKMDVGIICSKAEGFGMVTVEYLLTGLPVIGAANAGTSEIIEDKTTGLLYNSGDYYQLKEYMKLLIDEQDFAMKLGIQGRERAKELFISMKNTEAIYDIIKSIC